ncbi:hypothetical protein BH23ACT10_BH23ACT10_12640 [soil metagenome]
MPLADVHATMIHERVALARAARNPYVIARVASGWAVLADHQFLRGYCLLLPDPVVAHLTDLDSDARAAYLLDMARIGDALHAVTDTSRVNYEILGNLVPALHAHIIPRYTDEPPERLAGPVWWYPWDTLHSVPFSEEDHGPLRDALAAALQA